MPSTAQILAPLASGFATQEEAQDWERWFRARIEARRADGRPRVPHAQVMARIDAILADAASASQRRSGQAHKPT